MTTTIQDTGRASAGIRTPLGTLRVEDLAGIEDLEERGAKAAALTRVAEERANVERSTRDMAGLVLIQPYLEAQRPFDDEMARIKDELEAGKIDSAEAWNLRMEAAEKHRADLQSVRFKPVHIYRDTIGVSRGLFVRMQQRATEKLPEFRDDHGKLLTPDQLQRLAIHAREECKRYDAIAKRARAIRDEVGLMLLNGNPKIGRPAMSNADVARLFKLTTARVAQMRYGTR
jgi:hypothetical protein